MEQIDTGQSISLYFYLGRTVCDPMLLEHCQVPTILLTMEIIMTKLISTLSSVTDLWLVLLTSCVMFWPLPFEFWPVSLAIPHPPWPLLIDGDVKPYYTLYPLPCIARHVVCTSLITLNALSLSDLELWRLESDRLGEYLQNGFMHSWLFVFFFFFLGAVVSAPPCCPAHCMYLLLL